MNNKIANIIKGYISPLAWTDKIAGLVQTAVVTEKTADARIENSYPISCDMTEDQCKQGHYQDLAPDSSKKSVVYFEDRGGCTFDHREGNKLFYTASLRLVVWINLRILGCDECGTSKDNCRVSGDYVVDVIKTLPQVPFDSGGFLRIVINPPSQAERSVDIFSRYTYKESKTQYLLYPFDFFALDLDVEFTINTACDEPSVIPCE